ncbi:MAG: IS3 family transposase [Candidatus Cloacimonetes bacterium]|nr:IS3 family transposase [Candidatus Cloacimonadota bacterium]
MKPEDSFKDKTILELEEKVQALQAALSEKVLENCALQAIVNVTERKYGLGVKKKDWFAIITECRAVAQESEVAANMQTICGLFGRSKQSYYQYRKRFARRQALVEDIVSAVQRIHAKQPFVGARKLQHMLVTSGLQVGRDRLFDILGDYGMLSPIYRSHRRTSLGRRSQYPNLVKEAVVRRIGEIIASDIMYIRTRKGFVYLSLTSDQYSDAILGYSLQPDLGTQSPALALRRAMKKLRQAGISVETKGCIHHSDHGRQFTSNRFQKALRGYGYRTSMTGPGKCYDNAKAERINGILKHELGLKQRFRDYDDALRHVEEAIRIYNEERLIITQDYRTPRDILNAA